MCLIWLNLIILNINNVEYNFFLGNNEIAKLSVIDKKIIYIKFIWNIKMIFMGIYNSFLYFLFYFYFLALNKRHFKW